MIASIRSVVPRFGRSKKDEKVDMTARLKKPVIIGPKVRIDPESAVGGKVALEEIKRFTNELLIKFCYGSCRPKALAAPEMKDVKVLYQNLFDQLSGVPGIRIFDTEVQAGWGNCSLNVDPGARLFVLPEKINFFTGEHEGVSLPPKFPWIINWFVKKYHTTHSFPDVRYFMYLKANPHMVPEHMKNGKYHIAIGTVITVPSAHVPVARWEKGVLAQYLVPLKQDFEIDEIEIIMWRKLGK